MSPMSIQCLISKSGDAWHWHRRWGQIHIDHLNKLMYKDLVVGLPKHKFEKDKLCDACKNGRQIKNLF